MGWISEAMEMMILSYVWTRSSAYMGLTSKQESLITTVVFVGMMVGAYSWGLLSDKYGRRKGFLVPAIVTSGSGLLSSFAPNYVTLILSRCLVGLDYYAKVGLEVVTCFVCFPFIASSYIYIMTPESPRYLCLKGRKNNALRILEKIGKLNGKRLPPGNLVTDHEVELQEKIVPPKDGNEDDSGVGSSNPPRWKDSDMGAFRSQLMLLSPKLIRSTLLLWVVFFGNAFSYYGLVLLTTELNSGNNKCNPNELRSQKSGSVNYKNVFITTFAELPGLIISAFTVDKFGRKLSMAVMFFICCIFMLPLVVHQSEAVTIVLLFGARICITGTFAVVYIYAPEIYPTSVRTTGVGVASSMGRVGGMICPFVAVAANLLWYQSKNTPTSPDPTMANENVVNPPQVTSSAIPFNSQNTLIAINAATQLPLKLSSNNYPSWCAQFQALLIGLDLTGYIDGTILCPPATITKEGVTAPDPAHAIWLRQDSLLHHAILASVSDSSISLISTSRTSGEAWEKLAKLYANKSRYRVMHLKEKLSTSHGSKPLPEYLQFVKSTADELALIDKLLIDDDLTIHVLNGVGSEFRELTTAVRARETPITFKELHEKLMVFDTFLKKEQSSEISTITTKVTRRNSQSKNSFNSQPQSFL
ncbi:hypothetical protein GH714_000797 [Hevea brasiliensis]|uniref:Major facilitator superfamily (MFS) profile domain-containing protein n=1 Tax=Hevea brasiliensis TaxID=3981 RepID=A0A6A6K950_HEVBR|nr:hypothetical protein GH714_000797 [Hevea brasiliensis]